MLIPIGTFEETNPVKTLVKTVELDTSRHTLITGKSGVGKSTMLANLASAQDTPKRNSG